MVQATAQEELTLEFMQKLKDSFDGMADTREIQYDEMKWWTRAQLNHYFCHGEKPDTKVPYNLCDRPLILVA